MKLLNKEVDNRITIKLNKSIKDDVSSGIMNFGLENDYPDLMEKLIDGSQTAKSCSNVFAKFIAGDGFENTEIGKIVVGKDVKGKPILLDKIRRDISMSIARNYGVYIHCNISISGDVVNTQLFPFKKCRFSTEDSQGYCSRIAYNNDWVLNKKRTDIKWYNTFNLQKDVLESNIMTAGGIEKFKGQVFFSFIDDSYLYPLSPFDQSYLDMDTEYQVQLYKNRQIRNGFAKKVVMNVNLMDDENAEAKLNTEIQSWLGPDGDSALVFQSEFGEDGNIIDKNFKIDVIEGNIDDKLFENWEKSLSNNIRKSVYALPAVLIDYEDGKLSGTSGEAIVQATKYYNALTKDIRSHVAEIIKEIYSNHINEVLKNNDNWNILPVTIISEEKATNV